MILWIAGKPATVCSHTNRRASSSAVIRPAVQNERPTSLFAEERRP